jgi:uncharacterized integral membrane protein
MTAESDSSGGRRGFAWTPRRIVLAVIVGYLLVIMLANRHTVSVNFVFFSTEASLFVVLLLAIALGFAAGWLFDDLRAARRRRKQRDTAS